MLSSLLFSTTGEEIYQEKCASCHQVYLPVETLQKNFMEANNSILKLTAPTLNQIVFRLKSRIGDPKGDEDIHRMEIDAFLESYLMNPKRENSVCLPEVLQYFETMPSMKGKISRDELEQIGAFLYEYNPNDYLTEKLNYNSYKEALSKSKKEHKLIMIKLTSQHCHYCKKMDSSTMIDQEVVKLLNKAFVSVEIDVEKDTIPLDLNKSMTPTFIFLNEKGKIISKVPGSWGKKDFLDILNSVIKKSKGEKR